MPFDELIDPETLKTRVRFIDRDSDFYRLARALEYQQLDPRRSRMRVSRTAAPAHHGMTTAPREGGDAARAERIGRLLIFVPFTFPAWLRLRADDPAAAARLHVQLALNLAQSLVLVMLACLLTWYVANYDAIIAALLKLLLRAVPAQ